MCDFAEKLLNKQSNFALTDENNPKDVILSIIVLALRNISSL
jgi:hypothetical protein